MIYKATVIAENWIIVVSEAKGKIFSVLSHSHVTRTLSKSMRNGILIAKKYDEKLNIFYGENIHSKNIHGEFPELPTRFRTNEERIRMGFELRWLYSKLKIKNDHLLSKSRIFCRICYFFETLIDDLIGTTRRILSQNSDQNSFFLQK